MKLLTELLVLIVSSHLAFSFAPEKDVVFILRNRGRKFSEEKVFTFESREKLETFDAAKSTVFHVHGFTEDRRIKHHILLSKALLEKIDINLFFVDWGKGAKTFDYSSARVKVDDVAKVVAEFFSHLQLKFKVEPTRTTCIGFSLGAHICGLAHHHMEKRFAGVLGLDPAGPLFDIQDAATRISPESGDYVECIHTGFPLGIRAPICQSDFFVNTGAQQPGCQSMFNIDNPICSHMRAVYYYSEALQTPKAFYGKACESFEAALTGSCIGSESAAFMYADENAEKKLEGIFSVITNSQPPFGRGQN